MRVAHPSLRRPALLVAATALLVTGVPLVQAAEQPAAAAAGPVTLAPATDGDLAVRDGRFVTVSTDPAGTAPTGPVTSAELVAISRDGGEADEPLTDVLGQPSTATQYLRNDAGTVTGRLVLGCQFGDPSVGVCDIPRDDVVAVRLDLVVGGVSLSTAPLRVDYTRPVVQQYRVISPNVVEARFAEPVRGDDNAADWKVEGAVVTGVRRAAGDCGYLPASDGRADRDGCTRLLDVNLAVPLPGLSLDEDSTPMVEYIPLANRPLYIDDASNAATRDSSTPNASEAVDAVRPAAPTVEAVNGDTTPADAAGAVPAPVVTASGLIEGHDVWVERVPSDGEPVRGPEIVAPASGAADLTAPVLPVDGPHTLRVVARDPSGNLSSDSSLTGPRADGSPNPVTYVLDRVVPIVVSAVVAEGDVLVQFSEPVAGTNTPSHWSLSTGTVDQVTGSGDTRTLAVTVTSASGLVGALLRYGPASDPYVDRVGNPVAARDLVVDGVPIPVVLSPAGPVVTAADPFSVSGTGRTGDTVVVSRGGTEVGQSAVVDGSWSVPVDLTDDVLNELTVRAERSGLPPSAEAQVPSITHDDTPPTLALSSPDGGEVLAGGRQEQVTYTTSDANPAQLLVELSTNGTDYQPLGTVQPTNGDGSLAYTVPDVDTDAARVRLTAVDQAGNDSVMVSAPFTIDALAPVFTALTTAADQVTVTFAEPVSGPVGALTDWRVGEQPATVTAVDGVQPPPAEVSGARVFVLESPTGFGADDEPAVGYAPSLSDLLGELVDRAEQPVEQRVVTALDGIRPAVPSIDSVDGKEPSGSRATSDSATPAVAVSGLLANNAVWVERVPTSGEPQRGPETTTTGETATVQAPRLPAEGEHLLRVVARDPSGNLSTDTDKEAGSADGGPNPVTYVYDVVDVPPVPGDVTAPSLALRAPTGGEVLAGGAESAVQYTTSDDNPARLLAEITTNGGSSWTALGTVTSPQNGDGSLAFTVPDVDTATAKVRVTATDQAGNSTQRVSSAFVIDAIAPAYTAVTSTPTTVRIAFSEAVSGPVAPGDFRVGGQPATVSEIDQPGATPSSASGARSLLLTVPVAFGGDDTPTVTYAPTLIGQLVDRVGQGVVERVVTAADGIRPPIPTLAAVDGQLPSQGRVAGDDGAPAVVVDGLVSGHTVRIERLSGGSTVATGAPVAVDSTQETARAPRMTTDGEHLLRAVAVDPAGNLSTDTTKSPAGPDGGPSSVLYALTLPQETPVRDVELFACPPDQVQPAGFVDTAESTFRFEIDCLAAYGFTKGVTADRYAPAGNVTRAQMAIFVSRLARYGSVPLDTRDAGFSDLGAATPEARDAINALANLGVVKGVSPGRYDPASSVSRAQMASFLARLQPAVGQPFPAGPNAFDDDGGNVHEANIDAIAAAGIVQGVRPRTYAPSAPITRQQMAGFLIRYVDGRIEAGEMESVYA